MLRSARLVTEAPAHAESDHRIANHLGLLAALMEMDGRTADDAGAPEVAAILESACRRIYAIANVHRRLYHDHEAGMVDLATYLADLVEDLRIICTDLHHHRTLFIRADSFHVEADHAASVGILVAELVSNACKHAYRADQPGEIRVILNASDNGWQLIVEDDGVGLEKAGKSQRLSMGSYLIGSSASKLGAAYLWQECSPGTRFILSKDADDRVEPGRLTIEHASDGQPSYSNHAPVRQDMKRALGAPQLRASAAGAHPKRTIQDSAISIHDQPVARCNAEDASADQTVRRRQRGTLRLHLRDKDLRDRYPNA